MVKRMQFQAPFDCIAIEPDKMAGQTCIRGLRLTVRRVLKLLAAYPNRDELFLEYPEFEEADIQQSLGFAAAHLDDRVDVLEVASRKQNCPAFYQRQGYSATRELTQFTYRRSV